MAEPEPEPSKAPAAVSTKDLTPAAPEAPPMGTADEVVDVTEPGGGGVPRSQQLVVVYILPEDADWVTQQRRETALTNAQIVLTAIEASVPQLAAQFEQRPAASGRLFATLARSENAGAGTGERYVQLGLRGIAPEDREILASLVAETRAGSLSALVRAALRLARAR